MKKITYLIAILLAGIFMISSCTKGWEEMNRDPNNPTEVPPTNILAHVIRATGDAFFDDWQGMNNFLSYAGQVTKIQYTDEARLNERENVINNAWANYYLLLEDLKKLIELADANTNDRYADNIKAAAMTFSAMLWQMATDQWGYIPFTEALKGESEGITNPKYDDQKTIYLGIIDMLEQAYALYNPGAAASGSDIIGVGDLMFGGDVEKWQRFTGSLLLRVAIRLSYVTDGDIQAKVQDIIQKVTNGTYLVFEDRSQEAKLQWQGTSPYYEPWYNNYAIGGRDDHGMAKTFIDTMLSWQDPRVYAYAEIAGTKYSNRSADGSAALPFIYPIPDTLFKGFVEGAATGDVAGTSRMGYLYRLRPNGFTYFLRAAEVKFNLAEAYLRGLGVAADAATAQNYYYEGIDLVFEETSEDPGYGANIAALKDTYLANPKVQWDGAYSFNHTLGPSGSAVDDNLVRIWIQKWIGNYKEGQEVWAEMRRTDFPPMPVPPGATAYQSHNRSPQRYPYPVDEQNLNGANLQDAISKQSISDDFWGPMLWDTREGIQ